MATDGSSLPQRRRLASALTRFPRVAPIAAFVLTVTATLVVVASVEHARRIEQRTEITERVNALGQDLERRVSAAQAYLMSGAALFESGVDVDQARFNRFAATLQADNDFQGITALGWSVRVPSAQVAQFELAMRRSGQQGFRIWPQATGPVSAYVDAIKYVAPPDSANRGLMGFNLQSEPVRRAAIDRAAETRRSAISGLLAMPHQGGAKGLIVVAPVYGAGSGKPGQGPLRGFVTGGMRADRFVLASVLGQADNKLDLEVYDETPDPSHLMFRQGRPISEQASIIRHAQVADRVWLIRSAVAHPGALSQTGMLILLAGLIIASLLLFIVRLAIEQAQFDRQQLEERQEQDAIRATLTRELNHRVKNTLANVLSILSLSRRNAHDLDEFVEDFDGRVRALSATYNLLMQTSWGPASVASVVEAEIAPYFDPDSPRITIEGPDALVAPNDALSLGLLIHELVTNAAKFGALSNADGRLALRWTQIGSGHLRFDWRESGGPPPPLERKRGFGSDLIEKVISRELHSEIKLEFLPGGVTVSFMVPIRQLSMFTLAQKRITLA